MTRLDKIQHEFVECIPDQLTLGIAYVSIAYATVAHRCCCGCENVVFTPLAPGRWKLAFDGRSISLDPSIGNWSFPCQSHYWIERNRVYWHATWTSEQIEQGRARTRKLINDDIKNDGDSESVSLPVPHRQRGWLGWLRNKLR